MVVVLKVNRALFVLLIAITAALGNLATALFILYLSPMPAAALTAFVTAVVAALIVYFGTEEQGAPPP